MKIYLNVDDNNYLLSVATVGKGIEADLNLEEYDLTGSRIRAHKWENNTLIFDADRLAEVEKLLSEPIPQKTNDNNMSVYDELAAAYKEGVQEA